MAGSSSSFRVKLVIMSRGRAKSITSHVLMPNATLVVPETEVDEYRESVTGNEIVTIPDAIVGIGAVRNWVLDHFDEEVVVMVDDDVTCVYCLSYRSRRKILDPEEVEAIIERTALLAKEWGTNAFSFNQHWDVRKYKADEPFALSGWGGGIVGVVGRDQRFIEHKFKADIDFFLQSLLKRRIVLIDKRYSFVQGRDKNRGGNAKFRTKDEVEREVKALERKWRPYLTFKFIKTQYGVKFDVPRRQSGLKL